MTTTNTEEINERDTPKALNRDERGDVPRSWRPSATTIAAISGEGTSPSASEGDTATQQAEFRREMARKTPQEKGAWGERAVAEEARGHGHRILAEHPPDVSTIKGYDCVSWDERTQTLHIWEAKNCSAGNKVDNFGALDMEKRLASVKQFMRDLPTDDPDRPQISEAIQRNQVQWHIRFGPDTDAPIAPVEQLKLDNVDFRQYSYTRMLRLL
jgi:hypothetical protein